MYADMNSNLTHRLDNNFSWQMVDLLKIKVISKVTLNWLQFLIHITL